jgi:hypothetical protein
VDGKLETEEKSRELWRQAVTREKKELPSRGDRRVKK